MILINHVLNKIDFLETKGQSSINPTLNGKNDDDNEEKSRCQFLKENLASTHYFQTKNHNKKEENDFINGINQYIKNTKRNIGIEKNEFKTELMNIKNTPSNIKKKNQIL